MSYLTYAYHHRCVLSSYNLIFPFVRSSTSAFLCTCCCFSPPLFFSSLRHSVTYCVSVFVSSSRIFVYVCLCAYYMPSFLAPSLSLGIYSCIRRGMCLVVYLSSLLFISFCVYNFIHVALPLFRASHLHTCLASSPRRPSSRFFLFGSYACPLALAHCLILCLPPIFILSLFCIASCILILLSSSLSVTNCSRIFVIICLYSSLVLCHSPSIYFFRFVPCLPLCTLFF